MGYAGEISLVSAKNKAWFECLVGLEEGVQTKPRSGFVLIIASCCLYFKCFFKHGINSSYHGGLASFDLRRIAGESYYFHHRYYVNTAASIPILKQPLKLNELLNGLFELRKNYIIDVSK